MKTATTTLSDGSVLTLTKTDSMSFKKGDSILVSDACYWFEDEETDLWSEFCGLMFPDEYNTLPLEERLYDYCLVEHQRADGKTVKFIFTSTAHGDGCYDLDGCGNSVSSGHDVPVDAGSFAAVLKEDAELYENDVTNLGCIVDLNRDGTIFVDGQDMTGLVEVYTDGKPGYCGECDEHEVYCECHDDRCPDCFESIDKGNCDCEL